MGIEIDPYAFKVVLLTGIYAKTLVHCILLPLPWYFGVNMVIECIVLIFECIFLSLFQTDKRIIAVVRGEKCV